MAGNLSFSLTTTPDGAEDYNDAEEDGNHPKWVHGVGGIGMVLLITLAVGGNLLVIISYFRDKQLQTVHNMYILNLAVTDFFIGAISMAFYADFTLRSWEWIFGRIFCKIWCVNDYSMCLQSVFLMLLLSLDRVILLRSGAEYLTKETKKVAILKLAISWTIALAAYAPCVMFWDIARGYSAIEDDDCEAEFVEQVYFGITAAIVELAFPFITLLVLNCMVFLAIRKRLKIFNKTTRAVVKSREKADNGDIPTVSEDITSHFRTTNKSNKTACKKGTKHKESSDRKDLKAARFLAVLVAAFTLCWAPYTVSTLTQALCNDCINEHVYEFFTWLLWAKSSINPLLYASQNRRFKDNFIKLLPFLRLCRKRAD